MTMHMKKPNLKPSPTLSYILGVLRRQNEIVRFMRIVNPCIKNFEEVGEWER